MASRRRSFLLIPLIVLLCSVIGGRFSSHLITASAATSEDDVKSSVKNFTRVYSVVEENFADPVTPDRGIYKGAIPGMLRTLDPHSNFFDPRDMQILKEDQRGHYYGVGMSVAPRNGKTLVIKPFSTSPAYKAGIRPGDIIDAVDGKPCDNLTTTEVADMLKGPRGTTVHIRIVREGVAKPLEFDVVRDDISRASVDKVLWLKPGYAYMHLDQFNENTGHEVEENLKKFGEDKIEGLVLDLRGNPGGLLNEAVSVADKFLNKGDVIVSHRGRSSPERVYRAQNGNHGHVYPIVVLVNRNSASASEIVSGALQDHDRAWIMGDNTFGKGLVQTVYPLSENTGLALTTAKYYTPSGRLIQRDYSHISFLDYYYKTNTEARNDSDVKMTDSGRTVYGGGGISPDEKVAPEKFDALQTYLWGRAGLFNFTKHYFSNHSTQLPQNWAPDEKVLNDLHDWLLQQPDFKFTEADFTKDHEWIKRNLGVEMSLTAFGSEESDKYAVKTDPIVQKAMDAMPKAQALLENAKRIIAQRTAH
jgi:carboxyl-terminal processing protease